MGIESLKDKYMDAEKLEQVHKTILNNKTDELKNLVDEICSDMSSGNRKEVVQDLFLFAAKNRAYDIMKWMSEDSGWEIDVNFNDSHGRTALHYIAMDMIDSRKMESKEEAGILREKVLETAGILVEKGVDDVPETEEYAARMCDTLEYEIDGKVFKDWFLPSIEELSLLDDTVDYPILLSSSEDCKDVGKALCYGFGGDVISESRGSTWPLVWPVRAF